MNALIRLYLDKETLYVEHNREYKEEWILFHVKEKVSFCFIIKFRLKCEPQRFFVFFYLIPT